MVSSAASAQDEWTVELVMRNTRKESEEAPADSEVASLLRARSVSRSHSMLNSNDYPYGRKSTLNNSSRVSSDKDEDEEYFPTRRSVG